MTKMIDIQHLKKTFGENEVLKDISATVNKGQVNLYYWTFWFW